MKRAVGLLFIFISCIFISSGYVAYKAGFFDVTDPAYALLPLDNIERISFIVIVCILFTVVLLVIGDRSD